MVGAVVLLNGGLLRSHWCLPLVRGLERRRDDVGGKGKVGLVSKEKHRIKCTVKEKRRVETKIFHHFPRTIVT